MRTQPAPPYSESVRRLIVLTLLTTVLVGGCGSDVAAPTAPSGKHVGTNGFSSTREATIDLSGTWNWSETVTAIFPPLIAGFIGIEPEGPVTHATCYDWGVLTIVQTGDTFVGTATQTSICTTRGGQEYVPTSFPPTLDLLNGQIHGTSFSFDFSEGCPYYGTVSLSGDLAVQIGGTGKCEVFLRPVVLKTVSWQATR